MASMRARLALFGLLVSLGVGCDQAELIEQRTGAIPPSAPSPDTEGPDGEARVFLLRDMVLRQGMGVWRTLGWNLDGRCTEPPEHPDGVDAGGEDPLDGWDIECVPLNTGDLPSLDGDDCRDNNYGQFISLALEPLGIDIEADVRERQLQGRLALLMRVTEYNGTPNDPQVRVEVVQSVAAVPAGGAEGDPLRWDGTDTFYPAANGFTASGEPIILDRVAYVRESRLVMRIPPRSDFAFEGRNSALRLRLTGGTISGRLEGDRLEAAVIAGRWGVADFLDDLDALGVCPDDPLRSFAETGIRGSADVLSNPESVPGGLVPCDAVSLAVGLTGYPGIWSEEIRPGTMLPVLCP